MTAVGKGTTLWMAPELLLGEVEAYGLAADVFSLGCVLVELATREACATCLVREARNMFEVDDDILRAKLAGAPDGFVELAVLPLTGNAVGYYNATVTMADFEMGFLRVESDDGRSASDGVFDHVRVSSDEVVDVQFDGNTAYGNTNNVYVSGNSIKVYYMNMQQGADKTNVGSANLQGACDATASTQDDVRSLRGPAQVREEAAGGHQV